MIRLCSPSEPSSRLVFAAVVVLGLAPALFGENPKSPKPKLRRYDQGPLTIDEFRAKPVRSSPGAAMTMARIMFTYQFQSEQQPGHEFKVRLSSFHAFAVFLPSESWWDKSRAHSALLDHEQGHFDICEIAVRRVNAAVHQMFHSGKSISAVAPTSEAAETALSQKLEALIKVVDEQAAEENRVYDLQTRHGLRRSAQAEYRHIQALTLAKLENVDPNRKRDTRSRRQKSSPQRVTGGR